MTLQLPFFTQEVTGLELMISPEGNYVWNFVTIKKTRNKVQILKSGSGITELKKLLSLIDTKLPVLLTVNGKGIIHKGISRLKDDSYESSFIKILPSGKIEDFYIQLFDLDGNNYIGSITRKSLLDGVLASLKAEGIKLINCILGPFAVQSFVTLLDGADDSLTLRLPAYEIQVRQKNIKAFSLSQEIIDSVSAFKIGPLDIQQSELIAFGSGFAWFNPVHQITSNLNFLAEVQEEYKNELRFKQAGIAILVISFVILFINLAVFSYLSDQIKSKSGRFILGNSKLILADSLAKQVAERTLFLTQSGLSQPSRTSFYADQIAQEIPENITLISINIKPLIKNDDDKKKMQFETKKILITGKSHYALDVNEWIKTLKSNDWISSVSLSNYKQRESNEFGEFVLEIKMK